MKRNVLIIYIVILLLATVVSAQAAISKNEKAFDPSKTFLRANAYYEKGDWDKAIEENESILTQGIKSGDLFYNLGNCYLQKGALGMAMLNYERARQMIPRDSDLLFNYGYARSLMKQQEVSDTGNWVVLSIIRIFKYITVNENVIILCATYYLIILLIILSLFFAKTRTYMILLIFLLSGALLIESISLHYKIIAVKQGAIVIANITDAKFEPLPGADVHFPLYEGMMVDLRRTEGRWCKVKRPDGKIGWVTKETIRLIRTGNTPP